MRTGAECDVIPDVLAVEVDLERAGELPRVAVRRGVQQEHALTLQQRMAEEFGVTGNGAGDTEAGRVKAQEFLDRFRNPVGILP